MNTTTEHKPTKHKNIQSDNVAVIVLTWNGKALTIECVESLLSQKYPQIEIIVVDNASTDGTVEALTKKFGERITVIRNHSNLGYSRGNNVGIDYALDHDADHVMLLNNDTIVDPALIANLVSGLSGSRGIGIVGPKIFFESPPKQIWFAGGEIHLSMGVAKHTGIRETDNGRYDSTRDVDYVSGCALMAKREVFEKIGKLDESYRAYFEDADFCMRARRAGYRVTYIPEGIVWHKVSASIGGQVSIRKIKQKLKSGTKFFGRYASFHHWLTIPFFFAWDVIRVMGLVLMGRIRHRSIDDAAREGESST